MKTFRDFLNEDAVKVQKAWQDWMNANPEKFTKGGEFYEKGNTAKVTAAAKEFQKTYLKTGKPPEWARFTQDVERAKAAASGGGQPPKKPPSSGMTAPNQSPKPPQKPPQKPPAGAPPNAQKPQPGFKSKVGTGFRRGLGVLGAIDAVDSASQGRYGDALSSSLLAAQGSRRLTKAVPELGRRAVQAGVTRAAGPAAGKIASRFVPGLGTAYGLARGTQAAMRGDQLGAALGYGSAIPVVGGAFAAADIARDVMPQELKNKVAKAIGYKRTDTEAAKTKQDYEQLKSRLNTRDTRAARHQSSKAGVYGATQGSAIVGTGGKTTFDTKKNTITTGGKTAALPKTKVLPGGAVGDLAYKGGKPVYLARGSMAQRGDQGLLARVSRATGIGGQRERDAAALNKERAQAMQNTLKYRKDLGITNTGVSKPPKPTKK